MPGPEYSPRSGARNLSQGTRFLRTFSLRVEALSKELENLRNGVQGGLRIACDCPTGIDFPARSRIPFRPMPLRDNFRDGPQCVQHEHISNVRRNMKIELV